MAILILTCNVEHLDPHKSFVIETGHDDTQFFAKERYSHGNYICKSKFTVHEIVFKSW